MKLSERIKAGMYSGNALDWRDLLTEVAALEQKVAELERERDEARAAVELLKKLCEADAQVVDRLAAEVNARTAADAALVARINYSLDHAAQNDHLDLFARGAVALLRDLKARLEKPE